MGRVNGNCIQRLISRVCNVLVRYDYITTFKKPLSRNATFLFFDRSVSSSQQHHDFAKHHPLPRCPHDPIAISFVSVPPATHPRHGFSLLSHQQTPSLPSGLLPSRRRIPSQLPSLHYKLSRITTSTLFPRQLSLIHSRECGLLGAI